MDRRWILILAGAAVVLVVLQAQRQRYVSQTLPQPVVELYPKAPAMPPTLAESVESLLAKYEEILRTRAPAVLASLQPGLNDAQIDTFESRHAFKLPRDLRTLYRWRNGTADTSSLDAFPDHRFIPLDEAIATRDSIRGQVARSTPAEREAYVTLAGHRAPWLGVVTDPAGDGYFFDPNRSEAEGSFFFSFAEDGTYIFFPAFRNFLAAVIAGNEAGVLRFGDKGAETADFTRAQNIWLRYGAASIY